ncbi:hypothetical protein D0Y65_010134 [Glycine soja]|uniref:Uncharacterized protein n=1 Tax=Glycine soja TaxID=3848 RepID=A0A445L247_GLYSO|nr:hypothetical protein D0Y65_010134 [Glycine soja]
MNPTLNNFLASSSTTLPLSGPSFLFLCTKGLASGNNASLCQWNSGSIPGMSDMDHANRSAFASSTRLTTFSTSMFDIPLIIEGGACHQLCLGFDSFLLFADSKACSVTLSCCYLISPDDNDPSILTWELHREPTTLTLNSSSIVDGFFLQRQSKKGLDFKPMIIDYRLLLDLVP